MIKNLKDMVQWCKSQNKSQNVKGYILLNQYTENGYQIYGDCLNNLKFKNLNGDDIVQKIMVYFKRQ